MTAPDNYERIYLLARSTTAIRLSRLGPIYAHVPGGILAAR